MTEVYTLYSDRGDEYKLQFTTERSNLIADSLLDALEQEGVDDVFDNEVRVEGVAETFYFHVIYRKEHEAYAEMIAEGHHKDFDKPE